MTIQVYTKPGCGYCDQAKMLLVKCNLAYDEFIIGVHITKEELIEQLKRNVKTVPQIVIDKEVIGGFNHLKEYLLDQGYVNFKGEIIADKERETIQSNS